MKYLLFGNPNVGKTTYFNKMTKKNSKVSNFAGTTVEIVEGQISESKNYLVDVPGVRSLSYDTIEEIISFDCLMNTSYDHIINIVDINNLKRNLYLSIQLLELNKPTTICINMIDQYNDEFNIEKFKKYFSMSYINNGELILYNDTNDFKLKYHPYIENCINKLYNSFLVTFDNPRFYIIQALNNNKDIINKLNDYQLNEFKIQCDLLTKEILRSNCARTIEGLIFLSRRDFINKCVEYSIIHNEPESKNDFLLNKYLGGVFFLVIFYMVFYLTFLLGNPISDFIDVVISPFIINIISNIFDFNEIIQSFFINGLIPAILTVIMFLPQITITFILISLLEASGITTRAIIIFDHILTKIGLNGKSLAPMMIGFGCNVPAIMATRTITDNSQRIQTLLIIPFMSCSARLPIYILFASVFFREKQAFIVFIMHFIGVVVALFSSFVFSKTIFYKSKDTFLVEIPPYKKVRFTYVYKLTLNKVKDFVFNAGKLIIIGSLIIWILLYFNFSGYVTSIENSFFADIGRHLSFIFEPLGFGFWQATSSLITGFLAKELVVSQLSIMYFSSSNYEIVSDFDSASALSYMVFNLLYVPCLATIAVIRSETKNYKYVLISLIYSFVIAYFVSFVIYVSYKNIFMT